MSESLYDRMRFVDSSGNQYFDKDLEKARLANKFIGRGSPRSSTHKYMVAAGELANCGTYGEGDVVFVSAEGNRRGRLEADLDELRLAMDAGAEFVTDVEFDRNRTYNVGERRVAEFLRNGGYRQTGNRWRRRTPRREISEDE